MDSRRLAAALVQAKTDNVGAGYCGAGLRSVLNAIGYGVGLPGSNGQDWEVGLSKVGWIPLVCLNPARAPLGSVLVYASDLRRYGKNLVGTKGGIWGHAELVASDGVGVRCYVSDAVRSKPGGTVPLNFTGRAWVPPGSVPISGVPSQGLAVSAFDPAQCQEEATELLGSRLSQARLFFSMVN